MSNQPRRSRLQTEMIGDVLVVNFVDRKILDEQNIQMIGEQLFGLVDQNPKILLNFSNVEYLSSRRSRQAHRTKQKGQGRERQARLVRH